MKLTDEELIAAIESEEALALDARSGELQQERSEALRRYNGELLGNEIEGRSAIVDKGVMDTIQWIVPSLARIYLGGDEIGKFEPIGPEDEYAADCETEVCNWYLNNKNDVFSHVVSTLTDALLLKNGYMVGNWTVRKDVVTETYKGMADEELAMLMQDDDVEIVEHDEYPDTAPLGAQGVGLPPPMAQPGGMPGPSLGPAGPMGMPPGPPMGMGIAPVGGGMLHDVKVERKKADEFVGVESIPPDELLVTRRQRQTSVMDADFVQWRRRVTVGQLRAEGFKIADDVQAYSDLNEQQQNRDRFNTGMLGQEDDTKDPSRKLVMFKDTYLRIDLRGTGTPQLWRVAYVDGETTPALREEADIVPFAAFSPIIYPHSHVGTSVYDLINDICLIKTVMERQLIDSTFLQTAGQKVVDVNRVNMDDMLVSRPGGIFRTDGPPAESFMPVVVPDVGPTIMGVLEYMDGMKESRTGVTRYSAGLDANTLNKTASGISAIQQAANQRIELIARTMASGFKDLFLIIHALASKHSTKPIQIKLKGEWQAIDPRQWAKRTDFSISVGLGTGNPDQQMQKLMLIGQFMEKAMPLGIVGPQEFYEWFEEFLKAAGYKAPGKFVKEPPKGPDGKPLPMPQQEDPMVQAQKIKSQSDLQGKQLDNQNAQHKAQADQMFQGQKLQADQQLERDKFQQTMALQASNDQRQAELDQRKMQLELVKMEKEYEFKRWALEQELHMKAKIAQYTADKQAEVGFHAANKSAEKRPNGNARPD